MTTTAQVDHGVTVFVPGSIGNVGPGFDVLGLAVEGLGDEVTVKLLPEGQAAAVADVSGRDAEAIPRDPKINCSVIAALALLTSINDRRSVEVSFKRGLPLSGGLGSSAAASVGGALAAALASGAKVTQEQILVAALAGEEAVAGRHLDNIAPSLFGGLTMVRSTTPIDVVRAPLTGAWWIALASPAMRLSTKKARSVLPQLVSQRDLVQQMANTAGVLIAFATGDHDLMRRSLVDLYAEPRRAGLIGSFHAVKAAALKAGALGASISGAGPTVFALCATKELAEAAAAAMGAAFAPTAAQTHVGPVATMGARRL